MSNLLASCTLRWGQLLRIGGGVVHGVWFPPAARHESMLSKHEPGCGCARLKLEKVLSFY